MSESTKPQGDSQVVLVLGWVVLLLSLVATGAVITISTSRSLSPLENALFGTITFVLSLVGSVIVSSFFSRKQARSEYEQLARPALRRVAAIELSTARVAAYVAKLEAQPDLDERALRAWLQGLTGQMSLLRDQLAAATQDWRELLPSDYAEAQALGQAEVELSDRIQELETLECERTTNGETESAVLRQKEAQLQSEVTQLKIKLAAQESSAAGNPFRISPLRITTKDGSILISDKSSLGATGRAWIDSKYGFDSGTID